jgi:hypothetical protein
MLFVRILDDDPAAMLVSLLCATLAIRWPTRGHFLPT